MQKPVVYLCKGRNCFVTIKKTTFLPLPKQPLYSSIGHNPPMQLSQIPFKKPPFHRNIQRNVNVVYDECSSWFDKS